MEKLFNYLNNLPRDKKDHALFGLITYSFIAIFSPYYALIVVLIQAIGKEVYDGLHKDKHTADMWDAVATAIVPICLYIVEVLYELAY